MKETNPMVYEGKGGEVDWEEIERIAPSPRVEDRIGQDGVRMTFLDEKPSEPAPGRVCKRPHGQDGGADGL